MEKKKTIFLVDDDTTNLMTGSGALSGTYNVITLDSGARMFKMLERNTPDLILLDIEMPSESGYDVIKRLKGNAETRHIPVIFLTAHSDKESELEGLSLGATDYIAKPFSPPLLLKRVEVHLLVDSQKRELISYGATLAGMVEKRTRIILDLQDSILRTMAELVEFRDGITGEHIGRTQKYLEVMLNAIQEDGLYRDEVGSWNMGLVLQSAQLHDIGKIIIPDSILRKPGRLTEVEFEKIKEHTTFGEKIIEKIQKKTDNQEFLSYARIVSVAHHEKWDGSGYPKHLKGRDIPLLGRVMAFADVYDALVSDRPYKSAYTHSEALNIIISSKGTHFEPALADIFLKVSERFREIERSYRTRGAADAKNR